MLRNLGAPSILIFENIRLSSQHLNPNPPAFPHNHRSGPLLEDEDEDRDLLFLLGACVSIKGYHIWYVNFLPFNHHTKLILLTYSSPERRKSFPLLQIKMPQELVSYFLKQSKKAKEKDKQKANLDLSAK